MAVPAVSVEQMRAIEERAVKHFGIEMLQLMELAGRNVAAFARQQLKGVRGQRIVMLVGRGNNGGDAAVAARHLVNWGASVTVMLAEHPDQLKDLTRDHIGTLRSMFVNLMHLTTPYALETEFKKANLLIDGLLGYNAAGDPRGGCGTLIRMANSSGKKILAIDVPSGLNADTGQPGQPTIKAKWTLALTLPKQGCLEKAARPFVGELWVADAGVPAEVYELLGLNVGKIFQERETIKA